MTRLLVIVNDIESQPGLLTRWMISENVEFDLRIGGVSHPAGPAELDAYDGLIMLGGGYMPDETDRAPWLADEAELVRRALATDLPQFGICLGGQLIAHVIGGDVRAQTGAPEKGYTRIDTTAEAAADPVFSAIRPRTSFVESHVDRIVALPEEATLLATSEPANSRRSESAGRGGRSSIRSRRGRTSSAGTRRNCRHWGSIKIPCWKKRWSSGPRANVTRRLCSRRFSQWFGTEACV
jgi:GMP synthase-like glutamine amidotransferase